MLSSFKSASSRSGRFWARLSSCSSRRVVDVIFMTDVANLNALVELTVQVQRFCLTRKVTDKSFKSSDETEGQQRMAQKGNTNMCHIFTFFLDTAFFHHLSYSI